MASDVGFSVDGEGVEPRQDEFNSVEELLNIEWIKEWKNGFFENIPFWRYSMEKREVDALLLVEYKKGPYHKWMVIGYMSDPVEGLPRFEGKV